jgi:Fe-S oxidoreductase
MCSALTKRDFVLASKILRKTIPFPRIISQICDHPCEGVCKRREVEETIAIRSLEKAALTWAPTEDDKIKLLPSRNKRVAVIGAGLSGLTASLDLSKKGYQVIVFEASDKIGGSVWDYPEHQLSRQDIAQDFKAFETLHTDIRLSHSLGDNLFISELRKDFDAIYLGIGRDSIHGAELVKELGCASEIDQVTFGTELDEVFVGGGLIRGNQKPSPITSISDGRRAAISIDRFLQGVSLTASRENEGPYDTRLFTNTKGIDDLDQTAMKNTIAGYSEDEAAREAGRCLNCECMECVKVCEFLSSFKGYPKKYVRQIYNNLSIVMGQRHGNKLINSCSLCGLCKEVCPEDLHMGNVCKAARETMVMQGKMPPSAHEFALRDMAFSNSEKCALTRHQPGTDSSAFLFFPGCRLSGSTPDNVKATYTYLTERLNGGVGIMLRCCGAPADWAGRKDEFSQVLTQFTIQWKEMSQPEVIAACSSCYSVFKTHLPQVKLRSLWEIMDYLGVPNEFPSPKQLDVAVHDPCSSRHEPQVHTAVRNIIKKLGLKINELPLNRSLTECCGYGGLMCFANRELAQEVMLRRVTESSHDYLTYCAVCQDHFRSQGKTTWHLLDLVFGNEAIEADIKKDVDYSQIRDNRVLLKNSLLEKIWREPVTRNQGYQDIKLDIPEKVLNLMRQRMILTDDIRQVIDHAEKTGTRLVNRSTGNFLAHYTPTTVTYWVEYSPNKDSFTLHNAYSHRMVIIEESKP